MPTLFSDDRRLLAKALTAYQTELRNDLGQAAGSGDREDAAYHAVELDNLDELAGRLDLDGEYFTPSALTAVPALEPAEVPVIQVDLERVLWAVDPSIWQARSPGTLERIRAAFFATAGSVRIVTTPAHGGARGDFILHHGGVKGTFAVGWSAGEIAETLGLPEGADVSGVDGLPHSRYLRGPGLERSFSLNGSSFDELMVRLDWEERDLHFDSATAWARLESSAQPDPAQSAGQAV